MAKSKQIKDKSSKKKTIFSQLITYDILFYTFIAIVAVIFYIISTFTRNEKKIVCEEQPPEVMLEALREGTPGSIREAMKKVNCRVEKYTSILVIKDFSQEERTK